MPKEFDTRTETNIGTLVPAAQEQARAFMRLVIGAGINAKIISGNRTWAEQDELYAQGRTKPGPIVTNAKGGESNHNFGVAWDIGVFEGTKFLGESPLYDKAGPLGRSLGLEWGGDWQGIVDKPHFQCKTNKTLKELRAIMKAGKPVPVIPLPLPPTVTVLVNGQGTDIPGLIIAGRTWVGARRFTEVLGGELVSAGGTPFEVKVKFNDTEGHFAGQVLQGAGYVRFADINGIYNLGFVFDSTQRKLEITK